MEVLWRESDLTVNQVEERLLRRREIAHTTVLTTLDRMHRKGELTREKQGKAFVYAPRYNREEFERREVTLGDEYGEQVAVLTGRKTGARVVTQGAYQLKLQERPADAGAHSQET